MHDAPYWERDVQNEKAVCASPNILSATHPVLYGGLPVPQALDSFSLKSEEK